jgi:hypothetical protein
VKKFYTGLFIWIWYNYRHAGQKEVSQNRVILTRLCGLRPAVIAITTPLLMMIDTGV